MGEGALPVKKKIAILGLGFVGSGMARMFDRGPFEVTAHDKDKDKVWGAGLSSDVSGADLALVCVPTPMLPDGRADTSIVGGVVAACDAKLICIKSTVPPGTTDRLANRYNKDVHFSPEYMGEPRNFVPPWRYPHPRDARSHGFVTVGGPRASEVLDFFAAVMATNARYIACRAIEAEMAKYMENTYFATKVIFCAEFARIAEAFGVDYKAVRELWLADSRIDPDHTLVFPDAPGFGGKCLPKDTNAIVAAARERGYEAELLKAVLRINEQMRRSTMTSLDANLMSLRDGIHAAVHCGFDG